MKNYLIKNRWKSLPIIILILFVFYISSSKKLEPQDLELTKIDLERAYLNLNSKQITKDIEYLVYALDNAYAGRLVYPSEFEKVKVDLFGLSKMTKDIPLNDFHDRIATIMKQMPDGHLELVNFDDSTAQTGSDRQPSGINVTTGKTIKGKNIFTLKLPSFLIPEKDEREKIFNLLEEQLKKSDILVFDLRGNSGGYLEIPLRISSLLWGEPYRERNEIQYYPLPIQKSGRLNNPVIHALMKNNEILNGTRRGKRFIAEAGKGTLQKIFSFNEYEYGGTVKKIIYNEYGFQPTSEIEENSLSYQDSNLKEKGFNRPIFILIDKYCASACERFLEAMEAHPYSKTVGSENTRGVVQFGNIGQIVLPESHFVFTIATSYITYKDNRRIERIGYKPQILLSPNEDPFKRISTYTKQQ